VVAETLSRWRQCVRSNLEIVWPDSRGRDPKQACSHAQLSSAAGENSSRSHCARDGHRFESPPLHQEVGGNDRGGPRSGMPPPPPPNQRTRLKPRSTRVWPAPRRQASAFAPQSCTGCAHAPAWRSTPVTLGLPRPLSTQRSPTLVTDRHASSSFAPPAILPGFGPIGASGGTPTTR
jgi:hypothetical protein